MDEGRRSNTTNALPEQSTTRTPASHTRQNRSTDKKTCMAIRSKARLLAHRRNRAFLLDSQLQRPANRGAIYRQRERAGILVERNKHTGRNYQTRAINRFQVYAR